MKKIDINKFKEIRRELEQDVIKLLIRFQNETGLEVNNIDVKKIRDMRCSFNTIEYTVKVEVKI